MAKSTTPVRRYSVDKRVALAQSWDLPGGADRFYLADAGDRYSAPEIELARRYYEDQLVALIRDPYTLYFYWDYSLESERSARSKLESVGAAPSEIRWALRVYDVTGIDPARLDRALKVYHYDISPEHGEIYVRVDHPAREYVGEFGLFDGVSRFAPIARSNIARSPRATPFELELDPVAARLHRISIRGAELTYREGGSSEGFGAHVSPVSSSIFAMRSTPAEFDLELELNGESIPNARLRIGADSLEIFAPGRFSASLPLSAAPVGGLRGARAGSMLSAKLDLQIVAPTDSGDTPAR